jgi:hypothetical protein
LTTCGSPISESRSHETRSAPSTGENSAGTASSSSEQAIGTGSDRLWEVEEHPAMEISMAVQLHKVVEPATKVLQAGEFHHSPSFYRVA